MNLTEIKELLAEIYDEDELDDILLFDNPSYATAFLGISEDNRAVYDYDLMIEYLSDYEDMDESDAVDFISYNTIRSLPYYENHPIIIHSII